MYGYIPSYYIHSVILKVEEELYSLISSSYNRLYLQANELDLYEDIKRIFPLL